MLRLLVATALVVIVTGEDSCCSTDGDAADPYVLRGYATAHA